MKLTKLINLGLLTIFMGGFLAGAALAQSGDSLGELARQKRKEKEGHPAAKKVITSDDLPKADKLSTVGPEAAATENGAPVSAESNKGADAAQNPAAADGKEDTAKNREKEWNDWHDKLAAQKDAVALAQREMDVFDREYRLRAAAFYGDAGNRLRNQGQWDKDDTSYKQQMEEKKKNVDAAKKKLDDLQEQARKAGVPSKFRD